MCLLGFLSRKRDVLVPQLEMARPKISKKSIFGHLSKNVALSMFLFLPIHFWARETASGLKKTLFSDEMNLSRQVYVGFLWSHTYQPQILKVECHIFSISYSKIIILNFSVEPVQKHESKFLSQDENPDRLPVTFFQFSQRPKISSNHHT